MAEEKDVSQLVREFLSALWLYLRQQTAEFIRKATIVPLREAALKAAFLALTAGLMLVAAVFLGIGIMMGLANLLGSSMAAFLAAGALLIAVGVVIVLILFRPWQGKAKKKDEPA